MNDVIAHVKQQILNTTVAQSTNGGNALSSVVMAYVNLMHLAVDIERQAMQLQMEAAERGFTNTPETPPSKLEVAR